MIRMSSMKPFEIVKEIEILLILGEGDGCSLKYIQLCLPIYTSVHYIFLEILRVSTSA